MVLTQQVNFPTFFFSFLEHYIGMATEKFPTRTTPENLTKYFFFLFGKVSWLRREFSVNLMLPPPLSLTRSLFLILIFFFTLLTDLLYKRIRSISFSLCLSTFQFSCHILFLFFLSLFITPCFSDIHSFYSCHFQEATHASLSLLLCYSFFSRDWRLYTRQ